MRFFWWHKCSEEDKNFQLFFKNVLGFSPRKAELYHIALTHRSRTRVDAGHRVNNERLEYLGDAVLSAVVAEYLYKKYPCQGEGFLTEMRSKIVSRANLNKLSQKIGLSQLIDYNREAPGVFKSVAGDAFEALIGAIYLERGYRFTRRIIINKMMNTYLDVDEMAHTDWNFKSKLIDWCQKERHKVAFETLRTISNGYHGRRQYECVVLIDGVKQIPAVDFTIKSAEQLSAEKTYKKLVEEGKIVASAQRPDKEHGVAL